MDITAPLADRLPAWAAEYRRFAAAECQEDPLYVAICRIVADHPELLALMAAAPETQRRPNLLLAALHERVLAGSTHPLAEYYPSRGGMRLPDAALPALLLDFARRERNALVRTLTQRQTQTNEVGRCTLLWPALQLLAELSGRHDLALLDIGSSAGLNLGVDRYRYDYGPAFGARGAPEGPERPLIRCDWSGPVPPPTRVDWRLLVRMGLDPAPVDLEDEAARRWLRACLWPHDRERARRLDLALALARAEGPPVQRADDCLAAIEPWLDSLPLGVQPLVFNSWVLHYFSPEELARYQAGLARLMRERGLAYLCAEPAPLHPAGLVRPEPAPAGSATLWSLHRCGPDGGVQHLALAWSQAHGRWAQWLQATSWG
jgi:hypothetical protein